MPPSSSSVLTIAIGPAYYKRLAINLAASIRLWHSAEELSIYIVTDSIIEANPLLHINFIHIEKGTLGSGFQPKLFLDKLVQTEHTLFIDADCLVYSRLESIFKATSSFPVGVIGFPVSQGEWFGDIAHYCNHLGVTHIPKFNGGIYSILKSQCSAIYEKARLIEHSYDEWGLVRLRNCPNDELLLAGALASFDVGCVPDDGNILGDFQACPGPFVLDIYKGKRMLTNPPEANPNHCSWYPVTHISPIIVHFLSTHSNSYYYRAEALKVRFSSSIFPRPLITLYSILFIFFPGVIKLKAKNFFRPFYRALFGVRAIKSQRT
jgi:hypothetical protein